MTEDKIKWITVIAQKAAESVAEVCEEQELDQGLRIAIDVISVHIQDEEKKEKQIEHTAPHSTFSF